MIKEELPMKNDSQIHSKQYVFTVLIEQDEDGYYVATVLALKSCYTQAKYERSYIRELEKL
jgi:hypothetical protein